MIKLIKEFLQSGIEAHKAHTETSKVSKDAWIAHERYNLLQEQIANYYWNLDKLKKENDRSTENN